MSFTATIENDTIKLPEHTHLPNGATVRIELVVRQPGDLSALDWITESIGAATSGLSTEEILKLTRSDE